MSKKPSSITPEQIETWKEKLKSDPMFPHDKVNTLDQNLQENFWDTCFAGFYLAEELMKENCPSELISRIQYQAGKMSFGRDPWEEHLKILDAFKNNELLFEAEEGEMN